MLIAPFTSASSPSPTSPQSASPLKTPHSPLSPRPSRAVRSRTTTKKPKIPLRPPHFSPNPYIASWRSHHISFTIPLRYTPPTSFSFTPFTTQPEPQTQQFTPSPLPCRPGAFRSIQESNSRDYFLCLLLPPHHPSISIKQQSPKILLQANSSSPPPPSSSFPISSSRIQHGVVGVLRYNDRDDKAVAGRMRSWNGDTVLDGDVFLCINDVFVLCWNFCK